MMHDSRIKIERAKHRGQAVIKLIFGYDAALVATVKTLNGARWSSTMRCWWLPDSSETIVALKQAGIVLPSILLRSIMRIGAISTGGISSSGIYRQRIKHNS